MPQPSCTKREKTRFGSFNHSRKLSKETIEVFSKILLGAESGELVLKSISFVEKEEQRRIKELFREEGIQERQLKIMPWIEGRENHLRCYNEIDIALDPFPYGGATTTCEALMMGVPVLTIHGGVGALSVSILATAEMNDLIAKNKKIYKKGVSVIF